MKLKGYLGPAQITDKQDVTCSAGKVAEGTRRGHEILWDWSCK